MAFVCVLLFCAGILLLAAVYSFRRGALSSRDSTAGHLQLLASAKALTTRFNQTDDSKSWLSLPDVAGIPLEFQLPMYKAIEELKLFDASPDTLGLSDEIQALARPLALATTIAAQSWTPTQQSAYRFQAYCELFGFAEHWLEESLEHSVVFRGKPDRAVLLNLEKALTWFRNSDEIAQGQRDAALVFGPSWFQIRVQRGVSAKGPHAYEGQRDDFFALPSLSAARKILDRLSGLPPPT